MADELDRAIESLPPAGDMQGDPGHDQARTLARAATLMRDRALGFTYEEMAQRNGYADGSGARQALIRALTERAAENAAQLRAIENDRYELDQRALRLIIGDQTKPDGTRIRAIDARTRASARHARMNGIDAPVQVQISSGVRQELDSALQRAREVILGEVIEVHDEPLPEALEG